MLYRLPNSWTWFWNFRGEIARSSPLGFRICCKTFQHHLETRAAKSGILSKAINKRCLSLLIFSRWTLMHKPDNGTSRPVCSHDYGQLTRIRTPRSLYEIEQMNYENSPQQIELFTQMSESSLNDLKNWADELWKLAKANTGFHSVFAQMSEISLKT